MCASSVEFARWISSVEFQKGGDARGAGDQLLVELKLFRGEYHWMHVKRDMSPKQTNAVTTGTVEVTALAARARAVPRCNLSLTRAHRN